MASHDSTGFGAFARGIETAQLEQSRDISIENQKAQLKMRGIDYHRKTEELELKKMEVNNVKHKQSYAAFNSYVVAPKGPLRKILRKHSQELNEQLKTPIHDDVYDAVDDEDLGKQTVEALAEAENVADPEAFQEMTNQIALLTQNGPAFIQGMAQRKASGEAEKVKAAAAKSGIRAKQSEAVIKRNIKVLERSADAPRTKRFLKIQESFGRIQASSGGKVLDGSSDTRMFEAFKRVKAANNGKGVDLSKVTSFDQISLIFNYMKMLDPDSVVRESEFALSENATPAAHKLNQMYKKALLGKILLPAEQEKLVNAARKLMISAQIQQGDHLIKTMRVAMAGGADPAKVAEGLGIKNFTGLDKVSKGVLQLMAKGFKEDEARNLVTVAIRKRIAARKQQSVNKTTAVNKRTAVGK